MKTKLLRRLRNYGRGKIDVLSITKTNGEITGMSYGYTGQEYEGLFNFGETEAEVKEKACNIYLKNNIVNIRKSYKKYSRKCKNN